MKIDRPKQAVKMSIIKIRQLVTLAVEDVVNRTRDALFVPKISRVLPLSAQGLTPLVQHPAVLIVRVAFALKAFNASCGFLSPIATTKWT
jgi:hypothetical protein